MKTKYILFGFVILLIIAGVFLFSQKFYKSENQNIRNTKLESEIMEGNNVIKNVDWTNIPLKDVITQETFTISQFKGKPILIESFAVWCPACTQQQKEIKKLHEKIGNSVISISLNTDPNENEEKVKEHIEKNDFNWRYAIASPEMTQLLIEEFGTRIIQAPQSPVIYISEDFKARLLKSGVKTAEELETIIKNG